MFDPAWTSAAVGGALIGIASGGLMLMNGRVAGVSGIFHKTLENSPDRWRWGFLAGLLMAGFMAVLLFPSVLPIRQTPSSLPTLLAAGLLVGFGTRMASGCTSGHGVCGLARFSPRSLTAVVTFLGTGMAVMYLMRLFGMR